MSLDLITFWLTSNLKPYTAKCVVHKSNFAYNLCFILIMTLDCMTYLTNTTHILSTKLFDLPPNCGYDVRNMTFSLGPSCHILEVINVHKWGLGWGAHLFWGSYVSSTWKMQGNLRETLWTLGILGERFEHISWIQVFFSYLRIFIMYIIWHFT